MGLPRKTMGLPTPIHTSENSNHLWGVQCVDLMIMKKGYDPRRRSVVLTTVSGVVGRGRWRSILVFTHLQK